MTNNNFPRRRLNELPFSTLVLFILIWFTYGILFVAPYSGFNFNNSNGKVVEIYTQPKEGLSLQPGDVLAKIGDDSWEDYKKDSSLRFFKNNKAEDVVDIIVRRDGAELTIPWEFPGFNRKEFNFRFFNIWGLAYIFWFFGAAVQLMIRPKDERWWLFIAANYLTALWLILGSLSAWHLWGSSILLHAITWLLLPVYLQLHWVFPRPLKKLPKSAWILFYLAGFSFAAAEMAQSLPKSLYALAFLSALLGSVLLEIAHFIRQRDQRQDVIRLAVAIFLAFFPSLGFGILVMAGAVPYLGPLALFALPFMPLAYFYVIYRRQLGGLEVRVNRFISLYAFLILFGTALLILVIPITSLNINPEIWIFLVIIFLLLTAFTAINAFPAFQTFLEKRFFGIKLPYQNLQETYSNRITASTSIASLLQLLNDEVFPSLLVRQFAVIQVINGNLKPLLTKNINPQQLPIENDINQLASIAGRYLPNDSEDSSWRRLILTLKAGDNFIGFWLLGRRDPDDHYPQAEILILQSIANQMAIALSNLQHAEQLREMYQMGVERYEQERFRLAHDLHDSILNQLLVMRNNLDESSLPLRFHASYNEMTQLLRDIVTNLRPPMLIYGLKPAIEELADNLMQRSGERIKVKVDLQTSESRVSENIELHLFRVVQEACENTLRHAHAESIKIVGEIHAHKILLKIVDDGKGFDAEAQMELGKALANKHFGLIGIKERAHLIGAETSIRSAPTNGTEIQVKWNFNPEET